MKKKVYYKLNRYKVAKVEVESVEQEQAVKILNRETDRFAKSEDTYYCDRYHSDVISEFFAKDNTVYFGKDEEDTAFYYFKDKLSVDTLARIQEQADEYIVAAPVCYKREVFYVEI